MVVGRYCKMERHLVLVLRNKKKIIPPLLFTEKNVIVEFCVLKVKTYCCRRSFVIKW